MCLIAFAWKTHPDYKLILAANRDEFYDRPTRSAQPWSEEGNIEIIAGKDMKAGGTWCGVHTSGKWAAVTNFRDLNNLKVNPPSRGELVLDYLRNDISAEEFLLKLKENAKDYNGFNLLLGDLENIYSFNNLNESVIQVEAGIHGLSNAFLNSNWTKVKIAKNGLSEILKRNEVAEEQLFRLLQNDTPAPDHELPQTGLSVEMEKMVSPVFITSEDYGTRCSTLILMDYKGNMTFKERTFKRGTSELSNEEEYRFEIKDLKSQIKN